MEKYTKKTLINHLVEYIINYMVDYERKAKTIDDSLSKAFQALADPSRRKIIELLREAGTLRVSELADAFDMSLNGVSKHLKVLEEACIIKRDIKGREHFISIRWESLQMPYEWLHFYHHFWSQRLDALVDYIKTKKKD